MENNALNHHGVKGMRWGVRRYQNKDGTLTPAGQKRYDRDQRENAGKKKGNRVGQADPHRWVREDMERAKGVADLTSQLTRNLKDSNANAMRRQSRNAERMDLSKISDKELRDRINRELLERQYNDVFNEKKVSVGRERVGQVLEVAGDVLMVTGSALGVALSIKTLTGR